MNHIESAKEEFRNAFCKIRICKGCQKKECDYSTSGCPWFIDSLILNEEGQQRTTREQIESFIESALLQTEQRVREEIREKVENTEIRYGKLRGKAMVYLDDVLASITKAGDN